MHAQLETLCLFAMIPMYRAMFSPIYFYFSFDRQYFAGTLETLHEKLDAFAFSSPLKCLRIYFISWNISFGKTRKEGFCGRGLL